MSPLELAQLVESALPWWVPLAVLGAAMVVLGVQAYRGYRGR